MTKTEEGGQKGTFTHTAMHRDTWTWTNALTTSDHVSVNGVFFSQASQRNVLWTTALIWGFKRIFFLCHNKTTEQSAGESKVLKNNLLAARVWVSQLRVAGSVKTRTEERAETGRSRLKKAETTVSFICSIMTGEIGSLHSGTDPVHLRERRPQSKETSANKDAPFAYRLSFYVEKWFESVKPVRPKCRKDCVA